MADVMKNDSVWNVPAAGSPKREEWPSHYFLIQKAGDIRTRNT